jgi:hypothetical protein
MDSGTEVHQTSAKRARARNDRDSGTKLSPFESQSTQATTQRFGATAWVRIPLSPPDLSSSSKARQVQGIFRVLNRPPRHAGRRLTASKSPNPCVLNSLRASTEFESHTHLRFKPTLGTADPRLRRLEPAPPRRRSASLRRHAADSRASASYPADSAASHRASMRGSWRDRCITTRHRRTYADCWIRARGSAGSAICGGTCRVYVRRRRERRRS